ncbi:tumor necrosis factor receptor superfamily member 1A-like [Xenentodon cancila]
MERTGLRRGRRKRAPVGLLLLLMCMTIPASTLMPDSEEKKCPEGDYLTDEGICCNKCAPGFKLKEKCHASGHRSNCTLCPSGQFSDQLNYFRNCKSCRKCKLKKHEIVEKACERERDTICRCMDGYYKFKIDSQTSECHRCTSCNPDEIIKEKCTPYNNTVCGCKQNYHRVNGKCKPCESCTKDCALKCSVTTLGTKSPDHPHNLFINVVCGVVAGFVILVVLVGFITYMSTKKHYKKKTQSLSSQRSDAFSSSCKEVFINTEETSENSGLDSSAQSPMCEKDQSKLPDCVPLEIKNADLIYTVLDLVPVLQVKQLVRFLGVTDTEIEQAEMDYRSCREAHYQILRMWAERGSRAAGGGQGGILHRLPLEELLDKLRQMHLGRAAEELETKYGIQ